MPDILEAARTSPEEIRKSLEAGEDVNKRNKV